MRIAVEAGEPPEGIQSEANIVRRYMRWVRFISVILLIASVGLLAHSDNARRMLLRLEALRALESSLQRDISALPPRESVIKEWPLPQSAPVYMSGTTLSLILATDSSIAAKSTVVTKTPAKADAIVVPDYENGDGIRLCEPKPDPNTTPVNTPSSTPVRLSERRWREPVTQKAAALCHRDDDLKVRLAMTYSGLADWNCLTHRLISPWNFLRSDKDGCGSPSIEKLPAELTTESWRSHESWVTAGTAVMTGFVLPLMLGCLGGCAYALRRIDSKLASWTLEPNDGEHTIVRIALAALLGGLVGVVWTTGETVTLGGFTLTLAAIALFVGFSVEAVLKLIEKLVQTVIATVGDTPAAPPKPK